MVAKNRFCNNQTCNFKLHDNIVNNDDKFYDGPVFSKKTFKITMNKTYIAFVIPSLPHSEIIS